MLRSVIASALIVAFSLGAPNRAAADDVKAAKAHYKQGIAFGNDGKFEEAAKAFHLATKAVPRFEQAYRMMGRAYEKLTRWPEALACYRTAIEVDKKKRHAGHQALGKLLRKMGVYKLAVDAYQTAIERYEKKHKKEKFVDGHFDLGLVYVDMKLLGQAIKEFRATLEGDPEHKRARLMLARMLLASGDLDASAAEFTKLREKNPQNKDAIYGLGLVERQRENKDAAKKLFIEACKLGHKKACEAKKTRYRTLH